MRSCFSHENRFISHSWRPSEDELFFNKNIFKRKVGIHNINDRKIKFHHRYPEFRKEKTIFFNIQECLSKIRFNFNFNRTEIKQKVGQFY